MPTSAKALPVVEWEQDSHPSRTFPAVKPLAKYLNDHLSGSVAALNLLDTLTESDPQDAEFYRQLHTEISGNRETLLKMIRSAGFHRAYWLERAAALTSAVGQWRLRWHGLSAGHLGLLEALEVLELGIQGQALLWRCLKENAGPLGLWENVDFDSLITSAETQRNQVENHRLTAARRAFLAA